MPSPENFEKLIAGNAFSKHFRLYSHFKGVGNSKETDSDPKMNILRILKYKYNY